MKLIKFYLFSILVILVCSNVKSQEITMFPTMWGMEYYQDDKEITKAEVKSIFSKNEEVYAHWKKANTKDVVAGIALVGEFVGVFWATSELLNDDPSLSKRDKAINAVGPMAGGIVGAVVGLIYMNSASKSRRRAILTYNKQLDDQTTFRIEPITNGAGFGLALKW
ncbi:hypothetical protein [Maribacter confluentis]